MSFTFKQGDSRWAKHKYPLGNKKGSTMKTSGCCPTSVADLVYNLNAKILPPDCADYSSKIGGATQGGASYHDTPTKLMKHYGFEARTRAKMSDFFADMNKGCWGMLLFRSGVKGNVRWTSGGHYVAVTGYKVANGRHYVFTRDPGARNHTGWYCYETQIKGLVKIAYTFNLPAKKPTPTPTKSNAEKIAAKAKELAYPYGTKAATAAYKGGTYTTAFRTAYRKAFPELPSWAKKRGPYVVGASCDAFVATVLRASGVDTAYPLGRGTAWSNGQMEHLAKSSKFYEVKPADIKAGDIIIYDKDSTGKTGHTCICVGSMVAEASYGDFYGKITNTLKTRLYGKAVKKVKVYRAR